MFVIAVVCVLFVQRQSGERLAELFGVEVSRLALNTRESRELRDSERSHPILVSLRIELIGPVAFGSGEGCEGRAWLRDPKASGKL